MSVTVVTSAIEIVDKDDAEVANGEYSNAVACSFGTTSSGKIESVVLRMTELDAGAILSPAGSILFFNADPSISAGDADISAAQAAMLCGQIDVAAADWTADTAVAWVVAIPSNPVPFESLSELYICWSHADATPINSGATDDEEMYATVRISLD